MGDFIVGNYWLSQAEMDNNFLWLVPRLRGYGYTDESIAGMAGNWETESHMTSGIWQGLAEPYSNLNIGFGLCQWTPATKMINYAREIGKEPEDINAQLMRIKYELDNGLQWVTHSSHPMSFADFVKSHESPEYLAQVWLYNYEMPTNLNQPNRSTQARYYYNMIGSAPPINPDEPDVPITPTTNSGMKLMFYLKPF